MFRLLAPQMAAYHAKPNPLPAEHSRAHGRPAPSDQDPPRLQYQQKVKPRTLIPFLEHAVARELQCDSKGWAESPEHGENSGEGDGVETQEERNTT